jgi:hypothetical protein
MMAKNLITERKFGKLTIHFDGVLTKGSNKFVKCICECGNNTEIMAHKVISGHTKSCGKCNVIRADDLAKMKFRFLRTEYKHDIHKGSNKKIEWICDCGTKIMIIAASVISGQTSSCIACSKLRASKILSIKAKRPFRRRDIICKSEIMKFGNLTMKYPSNISPCSIKKVMWVCDCKKEATISIVKVVSGHTKSCGKCSVITADELLKMQFGKLKAKNPIDIKPSSSNKIAWICSCGNETNKPIVSVLSGNTSSCGMC